ncbi:NAD(P)H-dependent oxidoreductase [Candidatus Bathyarchaeota archaeon]|nr:NAD(P)H-dependent oxidoreductase [Candidatus Bathyarchaeota archaeon]MBS7630400.1 NAD(P)H-dependent oxidoreductase [Candidatus Bathyarchaeota archaeon]
MNETRIFGFGGSLRKDSFNWALLEAAVKLTPTNARLEVFSRNDLEQVPLFNQDMEHNPPDVVRIFKNMAKKSDSILISTPEYNFSFPGLLKNLIDWASRPDEDNVFNGKPVAIMSASTGIFGGIRAQFQLRQTLLALNMHPLNRPIVAIGNAATKIDENGCIRDEKTKKRIEELLKALIEWTKRLKANG